jgi:acyl-CoA synthetase (NDP forming)
MRRDDTVSLDSLFNPHSIAVFGASSEPRKIGGRPIHYLKETGFSGKVWPINPHHREVQGLAAYPDLASVPGEVDQALIALPAVAVADAVDACVARGLRSIVIFSAGFQETGAKGAALQADIVARCRRAGIRMLGPNCLGLASFRSGAYSTFSHNLEFAPPSPGPIAMVSQSGAVGTWAMFKGVKRGMTFSRFVATGNEADVDVADCIEWLASDPETQVIAGYLESCQHGRRLVAALETARVAGKPVVLMKSGASEAGSVAAASHTGSLAGSDAAYEAAFRATGAVRARSIDELLDVAGMAARSVLPRGKRLGVVTVSGGFGVMMADAAVPVGVQLPGLPAEVQARIKATLAFAASANPVDVTPQILNNFALLRPALAAMLEGDHFDSLVGFFGVMGLDPHLIDPLKQTIGEARAAHPDRLVALCMVTTPEVEAELASAGIPILDDPNRIVTTIARLAEVRAAMDRGPAGFLTPVRPAAAVGGPIAPSTATALLAEAGIAFVAERLATDAAGAARAAERIGGPVALKIASPDIAHKSDVGGVVLNVAGGAEAADAFARIVASVRAARPEARIDGVALSPMIAGGVETVIGTVNDPDFGPLVMFGLGGIHVETLKDVAFRLAPVSDAEARSMIHEIRGLPVLRGARGAPPSDIDALARAITALSRFAAAHATDIASVDINPFIVLPKGGMAVDALIVPANSPGNTPTAARGARHVIQSPCQQEGVQ